MILMIPKNNEEALVAKTQKEGQVNSNIFVYDEISIRIL